MPTKYDTNPLDPEFPEKAKAAAEGQQTNTLPYNGAETQAFPYVAPAAEQQTRRFSEPEVSAYSAPYTAPSNGQYMPANYQSVSFGNVETSSSRKVAKIGLPQNIMTAVPYIPWYPGLIAAAVMLFVVPRSEAKVRFHAAQGLSAHVAIWIIAGILTVMGGAAGIGGSAHNIFILVTSIMLLVFAIKSWQGKPIHIQSIEALTNWLEEKISPKS